MSVDGKCVVVTGTFSRSRGLIEAELSAAGAVVTGSVSGKTEILVCGEKAGSKLAKAQKLKLPIVSEAELQSLLSGTLVFQDATEVTAKTKAPAAGASEKIFAGKPSPKPSAKPKPKAKPKDTALDAAALLERTKTTIAANIFRMVDRPKYKQLEADFREEYPEEGDENVHLYLTQELMDYGQWRHMEPHIIAVEDSIKVCLASGQVELAQALCSSLPEVFQGHALLVLAEAGHFDKDAAIDAIVVGVQEGFDSGRESAPFAVARALQVVARLGTESSRIAELEAFIDPVVDSMFVEPVMQGSGTYGGKRSLEIFGPFLQAMMDCGKTKDVQRIQKKLLQTNAKQLGSALQAWAPPFPWAVPDKTPATAMRMMQTCDDPRSLLSKEVLVKFAQWSLVDLEKLAGVSPFCVEGFTRTALYPLLHAAGRPDDAETLLLADIESLSVQGQQRRKELLAEPVEVDVAAEFAQWPALCQRGPKDSVMSVVDRLLGAGSVALDGDVDPEKVEQLWPAIDELLQDEFRSSYDQGVEQRVRDDFKQLKLDTTIKRDGMASSGVRKLVEDDLKTFKADVGFARDTYQKNNSAKSLVARAILIGASDLALKAAKKVTKAERPSVALKVAQSALPANPGVALATVDALSDAPHFVVSQLLAQLWEAVLAK